MHRESASHGVDLEDAWPGQAAQHGKARLDKLHVTARASGANRWAGDGSGTGAAMGPHVNRWPGSGARKWMPEARLLKSASASSTRVGPDSGRTRCRGPGCPAGGHVDR